MGRIALHISCGELAMGIRVVSRKNLLDSYRMADQLLYSKDSVGGSTTSVTSMQLDRPTNLRAAHSNTINRLVWQHSHMPTSSCRYRSLQPNPALCCYGVFLPRELMVAINGTNRNALSQ